MRFEVNGNLRFGKDKRKFSIQMDGESERHVRDKVLSYFGAKFGLRRGSIEIEDISKIG